MALKGSFVPAMMHFHKIGVFEGHTHHQQPPKLYPLPWEVVFHQFNALARSASLASCGALGGHFCWQRPWLAMVVLVDVGHWRRTLD